MNAPILVATHGSADAEVVLRRAAELAVALDADLHAVSAVPPIAIGAPVGPAGADRITESERELERASDAALAQAGEIGAAVGVSVLTHVRHGEPAATIVHVADEIGAGLIVVGSRGLDAAGRYVLGSVPERILFDPHGHDVLVVRTGGR